MITAPLLYHVDTLHIRLAQKDESYAHLAMNAVSYLQRTVKQDPLDPTRVAQEIATWEKQLSFYLAVVPNVVFASVPDFTAAFPIPDTKSENRQLTGFGDYSVEGDTFVIEHLATVKSPHRTGKALAGYMIAQAKAMKTARIATMGINARACDFFMDIGFEPVNSENGLVLSADNYDFALDNLSAKTGLRFAHSLNNE